MDSLPDNDARRVIELGLASGRAPVRKVALRVLAERVDRPDAVRRARTDSDRSIRRWAPELEVGATPPTPV